MCTFGDMMSLLLCFFIMLYSMSIIETVRWEALVVTLKGKLGYSGRSKVESRNTKISASISSTSEMSRRTSALEGLQPLKTKGDAQPPQTIRPEGTIVKGGFIRFELGRTELTNQAKKDLETLYPTLYVSSNKIMVEGHSAPTEIGGEGMYKIDIDLAHARAVEVMKYLISLGGSNGGLREDCFIIGASDSSVMPNRSILPPGTDPNLAGASTAVYLLSQSLRPKNVAPDTKQALPPADSAPANSAPADSAPANSQ